MPDEALFDSTFFIDVFRGDRSALALAERIAARDLIGYYSPVTVLELLVGERHSAEEDLFFDAMFSTMVELPLSARAAQLAGFALRSRAGPYPDSALRDAMIGSSALAAGLPVYTRNVRDFSRFAASVLRY